MKSQTRYKPTDLIGNRYQVHKALTGGMGEVYLCLDLETNRPFALKTFQQRHLVDANLRATFEREVAAWIALEKHPNIVRCFFLDTPENQPFAFLEWIASHPGQGVDLRSWLRHGPLELEQALAFAIAICRGLVHANQKEPGLVHCDLKPENILVAQGPVAKITDFGLARVAQVTELEDVADGADGTGQHALKKQAGIAGTPPYMAPEQWRNETLDPRTDLYAVGCILYELLTGRWPFVANNMNGLREQHLNATLPSFPQQESWSTTLNGLLHRCLAKERAARFTDAEALLTELETLYTRQFGRPPKQLDLDGAFTVIDNNNRGMTYLQLGRYTDALVDLNQAIALDPASAPAYGNRGVTYAAMQQYEEALADQNRAIQLEPQSAPLHAGRGDTYRQLARYAEALRDYNRAIELDDQYAQAYYNRGNTYYQLQQYERALADHTRSLQLEPNSAGAYNNRGNTYDKLERYGEAVADYTKAIQLDPAYAQAYNNRGITHTKCRRYADALVDFDQALQIEPEYANALYNRAKAHLALAHYDKAVADYTQVLHLNPTDAVTYVDRAQLYEGLQRYEAALTDYSAAIENGATDLQIYVDRGVVNLQLERYTDALADCNEVIQRDPGHAQAYANRGLSYDRLGQIEEALNDYIQAIQLDPGFAPPYLNLGALLANQGALEEALVYLVKASELGLADVADPVIAQIQTRLHAEVPEDSASQLDTLQAALNAFQRAHSLDDMQQAVVDFPFLVKTEFIRIIAEDLVQQVAAAQRPAFLQRLAWLQKIAALNG